MGWVEDGEVEGQEGDKTGISMLNKIVLKTYFKITKKKKIQESLERKVPSSSMGAICKLCMGLRLSFCESSLPPGWNVQK